MTSKTNLFSNKVPPKETPKIEKKVANRTSNPSILSVIHRPSTPMPTKSESKKPEHVKLSNIASKTAKSKERSSDEELSPESHAKNFHTVTLAMLKLIKKNVGDNR